MNGLTRSDAVTLAIAAIAFAALLIFSVKRSRNGLWPQLRSQFGNLPTSAPTERIILSRFHVGAYSWGFSFLDVMSDMTASPLGIAWSIHLQGAHDSKRIFIPWSDITAIGCEKRWLSNHLVLGIRGTTFRIWIGDTRVEPVLRTWMQPSRENSASRPS